MIDSAKRAQITSIIDDVRDLTIATMREDGYPQATTVSYVNDGLSIYFAAAADSQKAKNINRSNKVSLTINRDYTGLDDIEGISMAGLATRVTDAAEQQKIEGLMFKKFPQVAKYAPDDVESIAFFRVDPTVVSLLDYSKGFGHAELVET